MEKWEYKVVGQCRSYKPPQQGGQATPWDPPVDLDAYGQAGWELVSVAPISSFHAECNNGFTTELYYYFKRPIPV